jgi:hypothetical protein
MTTDPLISAALLGTARSPVLPPAPDHPLTEIWQAIPRENPSAALLQALALTRGLHRAGVTSGSRADSPPAPCPPETRNPLAPAAIDSARRLLAGDFPELLAEWLHHATAAGKILPARVLPEFLTAATRNQALRDAVPRLAGERGFWIARRHPGFSWLLESAAVADTAWDEGAPAERLAWLRQTRAADPTRAATAIVSHWKDEDAGMRESILRLVAEQPDPCDQEWLENLALRERRQEIRDNASAALMNLPDSAFRRRALDRARGIVRVERRLLRRMLHIKPPSSFDPEWAADGIKEKPPQGTGEKAWWLRQMIAMIPIDDWPGLLECDAAALFPLPIDPDWRDPLLLGWMDSARRLPARSLPGSFLPFIAALDPWPSTVISKGHLIGTLLDAMEPGPRFKVLDRLMKDFPIHLALDLIARAGAGTAPPPGEGRVMLEIIDKAVLTESAALTRPQARALAACIPPAGIQSRLLAIAKLPNLTAATEEFATTLEFRQSMLAHLKSS